MKISPHQCNYSHIHQANVHTLGPESRIQLWINLFSAFLLSLSLSFSAYDQPVFQCHFKKQSIPCPQISDAIFIVIQILMLGLCYDSLMIFLFLSHTIIIILLFWSALISGSINTLSFFSRIFFYREEWIILPDEF